MVRQSGDNSLSNYQTAITEYVKNGHTFKETNNNEAYNGERQKSAKSSNTRAVFAQCVVAGAGLVILIGCGMPIGFSAILLPQLKENNSLIKIDDELGSWIAAVHSLAVPTAAFFSAGLLDIIGRRGCLQLAAIPLFAGWLIVGFSTNVSLLFTGRIVLGLAVGLIAVPSQTLITEGANAKLRGMLSGSNFFAYTVGILLVYTLGVYLSWKTVAFCCATVPIISTIYFLFIPESPTWLVRREKIEDAGKALMRLRGGDVDQVNKELDILIERARIDKNNETKSISFCKKMTASVMLLTESGVMKPLIIISIYTLLQQLSGTYIVVFYGVEILKKIGGEAVDIKLATVVTAVVRCISSFLSCFLMYKLGRRSLNIISSLGTCLASFILAGYLVFKPEGNSSLDIYVISVGILGYVAFNTIGLFPLPIIMLVELLPTRARAVIGGCTYSVFNILLFGATKAFPTITNKIGIAGVFGIFGISALILIIFVYLFLPETKNRTLEDIEDYFQNNSFLPIIKRNKMSCTRDDRRV